MWKSLSQHRDIGLLVLRVVVGIMFILHGYDKVFGGPDTWKSVGQNMGHLGIHFIPTFWGFMAACSEFFGGFLLILGLFFRPACFFLFITMFVAATSHLSEGDSIQTASHAIELAGVFFGLLFIGPGRHSIDGR